jgi:hypothetical protein
MEGGIVIELKRMLDHQRTFNRQVWDRNNPEHKSIAERLKDLSMGVIEESLEFLRTFEFKSHRRQKLRMQNVAHSHEELIDVFKYWLSLVDLTDFPIDKLEEMYFAKSRVVQYRFQEEWIKQIDRPVVIVDIDQVLADYISGICDWGKEWGPHLIGFEGDQAIRLQERLDYLRKNQMWINSDTVGVSHMEWQKVKHHFRTNGGKRALRPFSDAKAFLEWCRSQGWLIVLITSRPIVEYPNLFSDTLYWLDKTQMPYDHVWWSMEKMERIEEAAVDPQQIVFAVDDSKTFVEQFRKKGVKTYHLDRGMRYGELDPTHEPFHVSSLHDLMQRERDFNHAVVK